MVGFGYLTNFGQVIVDFSRAIPDFGHPVSAHNPIFFDRMRKEGLTGLQSSRTLQPAMTAFNLNDVRKTKEKSLI
jgi:hypothetical protein